jgi:hypothetical protein
MQPLLQWKCSTVLCTVEVHITDNNIERSGVKKTILWQIYVADNNKWTQSFMSSAQQFCLISNKSEVSQQNSPI